jgi:hypothetical protein
VFNNSTESSSQLAKKRKLTDQSKWKNIQDYSLIKLPAFPFLNYLKTAGPSFIADCEHA